MLAFLKRLNDAIERFAVAAFRDYFGLLFLLFWLGVAALLVSTHAPRCP